MATTQPRAALYARISQTDSEVDKVENQVKSLTLYAEAKGYVLTEVYQDDGISAFTGADRPAWNRLKAELDRFDVVLITENSRASRNVLETEDTIARFQQRPGLLIDSMRGGVYDLSTAIGRRFWRMGAVDASGESEMRIERQHARMKADLSNGISPATRRVFGYESVKGRAVGVNETEAQLIRDGVSFLLDGGSVYALAKQWRSAGVKTTIGSDWTTGTVRKTLMRPRLAGWLTHRGELISQTLPAIITQEEHEAVVALLTDPSRRPKPGPKESALLSGILRCRCGGTMVRSTYRGKYFCSAMTSRAKDKTGPHQSIRMEVADAAVEEAVLELVSDGTLEAPESAEDVKAVQAELDANTRQQDAAQDVLMDPDIKDKRRAKARVIELEAARAVLEAQRDALIAKRASGTAFEEFVSHFQAGWTDDAAADAAAYDRASTAWNALSMDKRRDIIRGSFDLTLGEGWGAERLILERKAS